jgi:hypothetical protein
MTAHSILKALWIAFESIFLLGLLGWAAWIRYAHAIHSEGKKDREADVQTLFDGKK